MVSRNQFGISRYVMIVVAIFIIIINLIISSIYRNQFGLLHIGWIAYLINLTFYLFLIFIHPDHHRIIGIPLLISTVFGLYNTINSFSQLPNEHMTIGNWILPVLNLVFYIATSVALLVIFFKKKNYHLMDFIIVGSVFLLSTPFRMISTLQVRQLMIVDPSHGQFLFITNFLSGVISTLQLVMIVLYVVEAKRLQEEGISQASLDPGQKELLRELQKLYRDGILSFNEYQEKKAKILSNEGGLS